MTDPLKTTLLDLLHELRDADVPLLLGGGYGLYRKQEAALVTGEPCLLDLTPPLRQNESLPRDVNLADFFSILRDVFLEPGGE